MSESKPEPRVGAGRPPVIEDPEKRRVILGKIVPFIEQGMTIIKACEASGVPQTTFYRWKALGREVDLRLQEKELLEPDKTFNVVDVAVWEFWKAVNAAELSCLNRNLLAIQVASQTHWQAAAWWLERRFPKDYGRNYNVTHSGNEETPVAVKDVTGKPTREELLRRLTPDQLRTVAEARRLMQMATEAVVGEEDGSTEGQG